MGQTIVILNKGRIATELLGKRSALHSSRPKMIFASEMLVLSTSVSDRHGRRGR
jgi:hypothetical protein